MTEKNKLSGQRNKPVISTIVTLVAVVIMCLLGNWQLQRSEQKKLRIEQIELRKSATPLQISDMSNGEEDLRDFPFEAFGMLQNDRVFLVDNRQHEGKVGYQVVVPVNTNAGTLLVNFGWVKGSQYREQLPVISLPHGSLTLSGIVAVPELNPMVKETAEFDQVWPKVIQQIDLPLIEKFLEEPVLDFIMLLSPEHPDGFVREWQPVVMPPEKHLAYAVQWFGLAIACLLVYVFALRTRFKKNDE